MQCLIRKEKGSVIILLMLIFAVFAGITMVVSQSGLVYLSKSKLQNAVDAAALAGAQDIATGKTWATVENTALEYVNKNITLDAEPIITPYSTSGTITGITVTASLDVHYAMPQLLGTDSGKTSVQAAATANAQVITGMNGLVPVIALKGEVQFPSSTDILLKGGSQDQFASVYEDNYHQGPPGFRGMLSMDGLHGGNLGKLFYDPNDPMKIGCEQTITTGGMVDTQNGTVSSIAYNVMQRVAINPVIYMPVVDTVMINGVETVLLDKNQNVIVIGFAAFKLNTEYPIGTGTEAQLYGHFVQTIAAGDSSTLDTSNNYGLTTVKLVE